MAEMRLTVKTLIIRSLASLLVLSSSAAWADAASLFRDGKFAEAAAVGTKEGSPAAELLAARSLLAIAAYRTADKARALALIDQAGKLASSAMGGNARNVDALLQSAIAVGYRAKLTNSPGDGKMARKMMEQARGLDPSNALAWASIGGWHGESVVTLGGFLAGTMLGAKKGEFIKAFDKALTLDRVNPSFPTFYAFTLLGLDAANAPRARELLSRAVALPATDGFEALLKSKAQQVLPLLQKGDVAGARALVKQHQAFGLLA